MKDRLNNLLWEYRLGIATRGIVPTDHPDSVHYGTMGYRTVLRVLKHLDLGASDVFVDIGCGKGRVLCCAARQPVRKVLGVDISAGLVREARGNAERLRGRRAPVEVANLPAQEFDYSDVTAVFMFDPFGAATLAPVLERIGRDTKGRTVRLAYANPTHEEVFRAQPWLTGREFWARAQTGLEHDVAFYTSA